MSIPILIIANNESNIFRPIDSKLFTEKLIKNNRFDDEHLRHMVEISLTCIFLASSIKEIRAQVLTLLDSLVVHFTLISLAHYNNQSLDKISTQLESNVFSHVKLIKINFFIWQN